MCRFARAPFCRCLRGVARYGKDHADRQTFYGFRLHTRLTLPGLISEVVTPQARQARHGPEAGRGKNWAYSDTRYLIEIVFGQLTERYGVKRVRARDVWHLTGRIYRKVLAHTLALIINMDQGNHSLQFDHLLQT